MHHPRDIFHSISAPALRHLRIGFASDEAPKGKRSLAAMSGVVGFLRRSECALVELYIFLHSKEIDEYWLSLFRIVPSLRELTLCMPLGVLLSAEVLRALQVVPERQPLLPHLRRLTLITDESPALDIETYALAEAIESRVGAHQRTGGVADNLRYSSSRARGRTVSCGRRR